MQDDLFSGERLGEDALANPLRPRRFDDYIGQEKLKDNLKIFVDAAKKRGESLDHILFHGPPGLGKTTLAQIIAAEMGVNLKATSGPVVEKQGDLAAILTNLEEGDVLFIDEIHRVNINVAEILYPAMEDFKLDLIIGQGPAARTIKIDIAKFTLVGATTRAGLLSAPLRDRFGMMLRLEFYGLQELSTIVTRAAGIMGSTIEAAASAEIARRSRGTPRIAQRILRRIRDFADVLGDGVIDLAVAKDGLSRLEIDECGLDGADRNYLSAIIEKYEGGPVGIETMSATLSEEKDTLEDVVEPFLIYCGFVKKTPRGRIATALAHEHLGLTMRRQASIEDFLDTDGQGE